jgi:formate/nitrite transporter FocA (FNT family)
MLSKFGVTNLCHETRQRKVLSRSVHHLRHLRLSARRHLHVFAESAFAALGISNKLPAIRGYLTLLGAFVLVIGIAYVLIARGDLQRNADLILVGTLYKLAYAGTAIYYWAQGHLPHVVFGAIFGIADAVFFLLMAECWWTLKKRIKG